MSTSLFPGRKPSAAMVDLLEAEDDWSAVDDAQPSWVVTWLVPFALLFVVAACWAVGTPRFSAPDEHDHVLKAAATARWETGVGRVPPGFPDQYAEVRVPEALTVALHGCYAFYPDIPASCQTFQHDTGREVEWPSSAARYPPLAYVLPGLPSLLDTSARSVWWIRLVGGLQASAAAALAIVLLRRLPRSQLALTGLLAALSPMVLYSFGIVNPNGLENALCLAVWAGLLAVALARRPPPAWLVVTVGGLAAAAVLTRQLTALWVLVAVVLCAVVAREGRVRGLLRMPASWTAAALVGGAVVAQVAWLSWSGLLGIGPDPRAAVDAPAAEVWRTVLGTAWDNVTEMIGVFGWLDAPAPSGVWAAWLLLVGGLVVLAMILGSTRTAVAVGLAVLVTWALPVVLEVQRVSSQGYWWQGRYTLPFAVGIPLLAAAGLAADLDRRERRAKIALEDAGVPPLGLPGRTRLAAVVVPLVAAVQVLSFASALRRFMVGRAGPLRFLFDGDWNPPLPAVLLLVALGAASAVLGWWLLAARSPMHRGFGEEPAVAARPSPVVSAAEP